VRPVGCSLVHVDAASDQSLGDLDVTVARGKHQGREPSPRRRVEIGTGVNQRPRDVRMVVRYGPHQRGVLRVGRRRVDVRAMCQQRLHDRKTAGVGGNHQRRQPARLRRIAVRPRPQQLLDHGQVGVLAGLGEWRHPVVVGRVHLRAGCEQQIECFAVIEMRRPEQRCGAVRPSRIHVGTLLEQGAHRRRILLRRRAHQARGLHVGRLLHDRFHARLDGAGHDGFDALVVGWSGSDIA